MELHNAVEEYIDKQKKWKKEIIKLRNMFLSTEMTETIKWGAPVYTVNGKNVAGIGSFKSYVGIWFFQGVFLKDPKKKLINAQTGKTKALRQWRFQSIDEIDEQLIVPYIKEAIQNQKKGMELKPQTKSLTIPKELATALNKHPEANLLFEQLGRTKQRDFAEYIGEAKRDETKQKRIDKIIPMILKGQGLNDKYKKS